MNLDFKRILCPVDMSEFSLDALRLAVKLAECSDATLDILHVITRVKENIFILFQRRIDKYFHTE